MLHLAQVQKQEPSGEPQLRLLARQDFETAWVVIAETPVIPSSEAGDWNDGMLVLVDLSPTQQVLSVKDATKWVVSLVSDYLSSGVTPAFLAQEKERIEQGLQSVTLEKQELARKTLELEARREEIQRLLEQRDQDHKEE
ncbi:hypothetical protein [Microseira wollei]|uniref:Uncharacterized protein n=1 Tax=Microseira wollei NIES-4236 TaxID=2530354 RepID=A0AAV3X986_9CYAN|nr:hypothetical protein [Microseira wollei]GET37260.1 hypothetical protein MiSe_20130 [Microseira wollei NIES-4236]